MMKLIQRQAIILPSHNGGVCCVRYSLLGLIDKVCINVIYADLEDFHDHPWDYVSIILWGGYKESQWKDGKVTSKIYGPGSILKRKHSQFHKIEPIGKKAITLFWKGPKQRNYINWVKDNIIYRESKFWLLQGYTKSKMRKIYTSMKNYTKRNL